MNSYILFKIINRKECNETNFGIIKYFEELGLGLVWIVNIEEFG